MSNITNLRTRLYLLFIVLLENSNCFIHLLTSIVVFGKASSYVNAYVRMSGIY
mgnify:CR=1 FL=1